MLDGEKLGAEVEGPAVDELPTTTVVLFPDHGLTVTRTAI
jgi:hypothetical protein